MKRKLQNPDFGPNSHFLQVLLKPLIFSRFFNLFIFASTMFTLHPSLAAQTIAEKMATLQDKEGANAPALDDLLKNVNQRLAEHRKRLDRCFTKAAALNQSNAKEEDYQDLLQEVNAIKGEMLLLQNNWRESATTDAKREEEGYALWDQDETTLSQLVMEYGAMDFLYVIPPEMANLKINMHSSVPIPRESWNEVLEIILNHNGIGLKKINPYARQLFIFKQEPAVIQAIAARSQDLLFLPSNSRVFYVFSPPVEQVKTLFQFFEKFADAKQTFVYQVASKIAIVSSKEEIEKLLSLYETVWQNAKGKTAKVVPVSKIAVKEMEKILHSFFGEAIEKSRVPFGKMEQEGLTVLPLGQGRSLILIGQQEVVERAEKLVKDTEEQLQDPYEMTVFLYSCRHTDPSDLAKVLEKVYASLLVASSENNTNVEVSYSTQLPGYKSPDGYAPVPPIVVQPPPSSKPEISSHLEYEQGFDHFVPDPKTGSLLMVVRRDALIRIKELLRKLDVPKKMVQIEVLLFEKRLNNQNNFGLNMLKLGSHHKHVSYQSANAPKGLGVLEFLYKGAKSKHFPAYDIAYNFLMTQEDIQLNAAPSVVTVNQTPATISIVEERSINNGAAPINASNGTIAFENSFSRAQFGITIELTPTVHLSSDLTDTEAKGSVTLQTNITFDTTQPNSNVDRPLVDKRHIENEVRVLDGQTVILGGLRRKSSLDSEEKVPFLGEIPGLGKLFGSTRLIDNSTEMFFFITPRIVLDSEEELERIRTEELKKRAGDLPEFLQRIVDARKKESRKFFEQSLKIIMGSGHG
ncbi:MAG: type II secretion system protein GspD [Anaerolineae bacterium]